MSRSSLELTQVFGLARAVYTRGMPTGGKSIYEITLEATAKLVAIRVISDGLREEDTRNGVTLRRDFVRCLCILRGEWRDYFSFQNPALLWTVQRSPKFQPHSA